jgi:hypothetical protein
MSADATATAPETGTEPTPELEPEPYVHGESLYDRVSSMLMAVVIGAMLVVGWLAMIYATNQAYASRVTAPLQLVEVFGGGGGTPEGTPGSTEKIDVAGAEVAAQASNNEDVAASFEEPSVQETPGAMLDAVAAAGQTAEVDLGATMPSGGPVASGRRASKLGTGGPGLGFGPGDGGVPREQRWTIIYNPGQTPDEYARQLDALGVELAVISGPNQLTFISHFSSATPAKRFGSGKGDDRLYFLWQGRGRKASDVALLQKAGIDVGEGVVLQFYPKGVENVLAQLEARYKGRNPAEIRVTRFQVVPRGGSYGFEVVAQDTLR